MSIFARLKLFQKTAIAIFCAYGFLMVIVTFIGLTRPSGVTQINPSEIIQIRYEANQKKLTAQPSQTQQTKTQ